MPAADLPDTGADDSAAGMDPVSQRRAVASKLRSARKREFALLRERMRASENLLSTVAGVRGRAVRERPAGNQTLEKIDRIGAHLEALWNPQADKPEAPLAPPSAQQEPVTGAPTAMPSSWLASSQWKPASTPLTGPASALNALQVPVPAAPPTAPTDGGQDALTQAIADLFTQGDFKAVQSLLHAKLEPHGKRDGTAYLHALCLLETYRLMDDMDGFDDTVLAFVHWWKGLTPDWRTAPARAPDGGWALQGAILGNNGLALAELGRRETPQDLAIDCRALRHMDAAAVQALRDWLAQAQAGNYRVRLVGPSALVYLLWCTAGLEKVAQLHPDF